MDDVQSVTSPGGSRFRPTPWSDGSQSESKGRSDSRIVGLPSLVEGREDRST